MIEAGGGPLDITAVRVSIPFREPFATSAGESTARVSWLVRLRDAAGRMGVGEIALDPAADHDEQDAIDMSVRGIVEVLGAGADLDRLVPVLPVAIRAGLDAALVGIGRADLDPAPRPGARVRVNATIGDGSLDDTIAAARAAVAAGYETLKLKGGKEATPAELVARLVGVRSATAPSTSLRLDVNGAWDRATAIEWLQALAPLGLEYVEQPLPARPDGHEIADLAILRQGSTVRFAADESVTGVAAARSIIETGAADVLVVKPARVGGIRVAREIATLAAEAGIGVVLSTMLETGVGLSAGLAVAASMAGDETQGRAHGLGTSSWLISDLLQQPLAVERGSLVVRDLGTLSLDDHEIRARTVAACGSPW